MEALEAGLATDPKHYCGALLLDRDGVINRERGAYTWRREDFEWLPGVADLICWARERGWGVALITNQGGIARGLYTHSQLQELHRWMADSLAAEGAVIDHVLYCPHHHDFDTQCLCRKPQKLLFERALALLGLPPNPLASGLGYGQLGVMLGDTARDVLPASALGLRTVQIGSTPGVPADHQAESPLAALDILRGVYGL
jgi:D-glycero-D-manno-heptose 1,7-bisphosphate phosphatase